jgi:hypothetical protein
VGTDDATTVSHAENCLKHFLHPMPANLLSMAKKIAATVGPPQCAMSYTGHECSPAPSPEDHEGTCPQGFMCMPDPSKCEECACSCNTPADKLKNLGAPFPRFLPRPSTSSTIPSSPTHAP